MATFTLVRFEAAALKQILFTKITNFMVLGLGTVLLCELRIREGGILDCTALKACDN